MEQALDEIHHADFEAGHSIKTASLAMHTPRNKLLTQLDACQTVACLKQVVQPKPKPFLYVMNVQKETLGGGAGPLQVEFRGQQSTLNAEFVVSWICLLQKFVQASFDGVELSVAKLSVEQAWFVLFDKLVQDEQLQHYFEKHRNQLKQEQQAANDESVTVEDLSDVVEKLMQEKPATSRAGRQTSSLGSISDRATCEESLVLKQVRLHVK